jgi:hypothetical protein
MRRGSEAFIAVVLPVLLAGCASTPGPLQSWFGVFTPAAPSSEASGPTAPPPSTEASERPQATVPAREPESNSTKSQNKTSRIRTPTKPPQVVTLGDSGNARVNAEKAINSVSSDLLRIDRGSLQSGDLTIYDQANSFISAARKALASKDYAAASGFAQKASALTTKLAPNAPAP